ncbi:MAG: protein kinase [Thermoanaerobaculales bacterium]
MIGSHLGPYEIVAPIGAGGMGEVYKARDTRLGRDVAIKVLPAEFADDPDRLRRFEQEARAVAALDHPNILSIHDVGTHECAPYLVTELLEGESLRQRLNGGAMPVRKAVEIAMQITQGLAAAHEKGIVHRDLKPGNVFITKDGHVKILDFGIAKLVPPRTAEGLEVATTVVEATARGAMLGTVGYMSPEQVRGQRVDQRSDIFSFGCVLYEMLSGNAPFKRDTPADTITAILVKEPAPVSAPDAEIPAALQGIVQQCLEKSPEDRYSSAHDIALALRMLRGPEEEGTKTPPPRANSRLPRILAYGAAGLLAAAALSLVLVQRMSRPAPTLVPSLVALPCKIYGAPEVAYLTDAVPATLSTLLGQVEGVETRVPPTSTEVDKLGSDRGRLADAYRVTTFVVTSLVAEHERFAFNVQLVDPGSGRVRWSREYVGSRDRYTDLVHQAAEGIRSALRPGAPPVPTTTVPSEVELAFRQGKYFSDRYNNRHLAADFDAAQAAFQRALTLDPHLATAAAEIGLLYEFRSEAVGWTGETSGQMETWAKRALVADSRCSKAWAVLSMLEMGKANPDSSQALHAAIKAASFGPSDPNAHNALGIALAWTSAALPIEPWCESSRIDPLYIYPPFNLVWYLDQLGRDEEALQWADRGLGVEPGNVVGLVSRAEVLAALGRIADASGVLNRLESNPEMMTSVLPMIPVPRLGVALAGADRNAIDISLAEVMRIVDRATVFDIYNMGFTPAVLLARHKRSDAALTFLEGCANHGAVPYYDLLALSPDLASLRSAPRFADVLERSRPGFAETVRTLDEARSRGELPAYLESPLADARRLLEDSAFAPRTGAPAKRD